MHHSERVPNSIAQVRIQISNFHFIGNWHKVVDKEGSSTVLLVQES